MTTPRSNVIFTRSALLSTTTIIVLVFLRVVSINLFTTTFGRFPAMMIEVMASRTMTFGWSPAGYYEELFVTGRFDRQLVFFKSGTFIPDTYRIRRLKPDLPKVTEWNTDYDPVNRFGYIGPQWSLSKQPNTRRVAVLGDSITEGYGVDMNQDFIYLLANRLDGIAAAQGSAQRYEFLNFAVSAYHVTQVTDVALNDVPPFHPDVYVVVLTALSVYRGWDTHLIYLAQNGIDPKYDFMKNALSQAGARSEDDEATLSAKLTPFRMSVLRQALLTMKANAEKNDAQFLVILMPSVDEADIDSRRFEEIPSFLSSMGVSFVDLSDTYAQVLDRSHIRLSETDIHPNQRGHEMICDNLYKKLRANPDAWSKLAGPALSDSRQSVLLQ